MSGLITKFFPDLATQNAPLVFQRQFALVRRLTESAFALSAPAHAVLLGRMLDVLRGGDVQQFIADESVVHALRAEALGHMRAQRHHQALIWGRLAHAAGRRFGHSWLPFLNIIVAADAVPGFTLPAAPHAAGAIPRKLVQYWDKPAPPADVMALIESWRTHPGSTHQLFNDAMARQFLGDCYGEKLLQIYNGAGHAAGKSDIFRLAWLAWHGGVYIDADDRCVGDVGLLLPPGAGFVVNWSPGPPPCVNNWFIAARHRHPAVIASLTLAAQQVVRASELGRKLSPWILTGPGVISNVIMDQVALSDSLPAALRDMSLQREDQYRHVVQPVHDLSYRSDKETNWKLAF